MSHSIDVYVCVSGRVPELCMLLRSSLFVFEGQRQVTLNLFSVNSDPLCLSPLLFLFVVSRRRETVGASCVFACVCVAPACVSSSLPFFFVWAAAFPPAPHVGVWGGDPDVFLFSPVGAPGARVHDTTFVVACRRSLPTPTSPQEAALLQPTLRRRVRCTRSGVGFMSSRQQHPLPRKDAHASPVLRGRTRASRAAAIVCREVACPSPFSFTRRSRFVSPQGPCAPAPFRRPPALTHRHERVSCFQRSVIPPPPHTRCHRGRRAEARLLISSTS